MVAKSYDTVHDIADHKAENHHDLNKLYFPL